MGRREPSNGTMSTLTRAPAGTYASEALGRKMTLMSKLEGAVPGAPGRGGIPPAFPGRNLRGAGARVPARPLNGPRVAPTRACDPRVDLALRRGVRARGQRHHRASGELAARHGRDARAAEGRADSAGFETEIVDGAAAGSAGEARAGLEQLAARRGADAVVAIVGDLSPDSVEVWVIDKVTGKSVVRRVPFEPAATRASTTLAIRAIELLRSSFLEIDLAARRDDRRTRRRRAAARRRPLRGGGAAGPAPRAVRRRGRRRRDR